MMQKPLIIIENVRSAYNTGNIIRTAEVLWWEVILSWYTPRTDHNKVQKTALGAENIVIWSFWNTTQALQFAKNEWYFLVAAECTDQSIAVDSFRDAEVYGDQSLALIVWNEKQGVLPETLDFVDIVCHIPLHGKKDSLNVWQAAAIMMWELGSK